ncbi:ABC transporter [Mycolicibacterium sp. 120270]|uniref:ArnT family glycosyltransferase n=1 Tax=Mycolicibacterium sp. 120270 TaxID=3090600 RepID=UPI00299E980C|nr:ABC transporter [Mycolicibacterium sp. 120270]MDX1884593.1 ABC transporter [Mycolicibacterium sp. 120270]
MTRMSDRRMKVWAYVLTFALYLAVGYWLQVRNGFILGDALSRVSAAQSVLFSRDPHLAAIGFIFTPLTAMVQIPAIGLSPWWPDLAEKAFAGSVMSALFMAGSVVQIMGIGTDRGLPRGYIIAITALFALNPMIVFYGSNGMSEAPFIFFVTWAVRRLIMWMVDDDVHHLIAAGGIAMALSYLTRYDAVACIAAAGVVVFVTTYRRASPEPRLRRALLDLLLVSGPGLASFVGWAVASWLITGLPFAQFSSQYGNTAILQQSGLATSDFGGGLVFAATCMMLLAPTLVVLAVWAGVVRLRRPHWPTLIVPLALFGGVLAFQAYSYASGSTFPFLRFYIAVIPFAACLAMLAVPEGTFVTAKRRGTYAPAVADVIEPRRRWAAYLPVAAVFAITVPATGWAMTLPEYAPQEYALAAVLRPNPDAVSQRSAVERSIAATFSTERKIADYLDGLGLPESSVIVDTVYGFAVVAASTKPKTFVVPSDPDFTTLLNDPMHTGVEYLLVVPNEGRGVSDAVNVRYPTIFDTGAEIATLELEIPNDGDSQPTWRLYRVAEPVENQSGSP